MWLFTIICFVLLELLTKVDEIIEKSKNVDKPVEDSHNNLSKKSQQNKKNNVLNSITIGMVGSYMLFVKVSV